jgi:hypothetical protein
MNKIRCTDLLVEYGASFERLQRLDVLKKFYKEIVSDKLIMNDSKSNIDRKQMYYPILNV